eukprot:Em0001g2076a
MSRIILTFPDLTDITIGFASGTPSIATEGVDLTLQLCPIILNGSLEKDVYVSVSTKDITAKATLDYGRVSTQLLFRYGQTVGNAVCFVVIINNDANVLEYTEQFEVALLQNDTAIHFPPQQRSINVTIVEDPHDGITIGFGSSIDYFYEKSGALQACILMYNGNLERNVSIKITTVASTADAYLDYNPVNSTIVFTDGMVTGISVCISVDIIDDNVVEQDVENFNLILVAIEPAVTNISLPIKIISIEERNNDVVTIGLSQSTTFGIEGSTVVMCAKIYNGTTDRAISVYLSAISSTATEGADFLSVSSVQLRMPGHSSINDTVCTNVMIVNDTDIEDQEQFSVILETLDPAVIIILKLGTIIIPVDSHDSVTIGLDDENVIVSEIKGNVQICIDLKIGALERNVPVYLQTIPITATSNADYVDIQNNATLTAGLSALQDDKLCTNIVIINDNALENNEDFNIFLSTALLERGLVIVQSAHATERITIMEDMMDSVELGFEHKSYAVSASDGMVVVCVAIYNGTLERDVSVLIMTSTDSSTSAATPGIDFTSVRIIMTFFSGQSEFVNSTQCIGISILNDETIEPDETLLVSLEKIAIASNGIQFKEELANATVQIQNINQERIDYDSSAHILMFYTENVTNSTIMTECISIDILDDSSIEDIETFKVDIIVVNSYAATVENRSSAIVTIAENDKYYIVARFRDINLTAVAGETVAICVKLDGTAVHMLDYVSGNLNILFKMGDAVNSTTCANISIVSNEHLLEPNKTFYAVLISSYEDIVTRSPTVSLIIISDNRKDGMDYSLPKTIFPMGLSENGTQCIGVIIHDDDIVEDDEKIVLTLVSLDNIKIVSIPEQYRTATVYITEHPRDFISVHWVNTDYTLTEGHAIELCAQIEHGVLGKDMRVALNISLDAGTIESELNVSSWFVTFTSGQSHKSNSISCITVFIGDDTNLGNTESFVLMFAAANRINYVSSKSKVNITINEDPMDGEDSSTDVTVEGPIVFEPGSSPAGNNTQSIKVSFDSTNFTTKEGQDHVLEVCIVIEKGRLEKNISITLVSSDENDLENKESVILMFTAANRINYVAARSEVNITINEDPNDDAQFSLKENRFIVTEGVNNTILICIVLKAGHLEKAVLLTLENGANDPARDYRVEGPIVFPAGSSAADNTTQCAVVDIINDESVEDTEEFIIILTPQSAGCKIFGDLATAITIGWTTSSYAATEGEDSQLLICADILNGTLQTIVEAPFVVSESFGTAESYLIVSAWFVNFTSGQSQYSNSSTSCITMFITNDTNLGNTKSFLLMFTATNQINLLASRVKVNITIYEDPSDDAEFSLSESRYIVTEGINSTITICIVLNVGYLEKSVLLTLENEVVALSFESSNLTIREGQDQVLDVCILIEKGKLSRNISASLFTTDITALQGTDYQLVSNNVTFVSGQAYNHNNKQCIHITVLDDTALESVERFTLSIITASPGVTGSICCIVIDILEDYSDYVEIGFVKTFYDLTQDESLKPLLIAIRMIQGILETNVSLTVHLTLRSSTEANPLFVKNEIRFTSGESTNATHNATIIIPVNGTEKSKIFVATLRPVPPHVDAVRVINNQAIIIIIDSQPSLIPVIIVMTILPWILLCGAAIAAFLMCKRCRKTKKKKIKPRGTQIQENKSSFSDADSLWY